MVITTSIQKQTRFAIKDDDLDKAMAAPLVIADGDLALADPLLLPALDVKEHQGWRISYRTVCHEAKTFEEFRPRLKKMNENLMPYLLPGASRHKGKLGRGDLDAAHERPERVAHDQDRRVVVEEDEAAQPYAREQALAPRVEDALDERR